MSPNHHHVLVYLPQCISPEKVLRQTVSQVLRNVQNANVKLLTVSYPENFMKMETSTISKESLIVKGDRMQSLINRKTTEGLGCTFKFTWEIERHNSLVNCQESEKAFHVFQKLLELEKSEAPFKDTVVPYIELLQRGMGRYFVTEHNHILDVDLGVSNAQCMCFECLNQPLHIAETNDTPPQNFSSQLFSLFDEETIIDPSFL